jgi:hypothetical protein
MGTIVGNFLRFIVKLFKGLSAKTKQLTPEIIQIVTNIKNFVDSPGCDFLTSVIPGTLDDKVLNILRQYLPKLLDILNKVESIAEIVDPNERMKAIVAEIQLSETDAKDILLHGIAGKLIQVTTENDWGKSALIAEAAYQNAEVLTA